MKKEDRYFIFNEEKRVGWLYFRDRIRYLFCTLFYRVVLFCANVKGGGTKRYNVAVCAIFKNEADYLKEWIEFHKIVGVQHFYLYNNNSEDDYLSVLQPYIDSGLVTLIQWPYNQQQMQCYHNCIESYSKETKWLGFIDLDEFVVPKTCNDIYSFLSKFEHWPAVVIYWKMFCSSGKITRNKNGLVTEDFVVCWTKNIDIGKCFFNTAFGFDKAYRKNKALHHWFWGKYKVWNIPPINIFSKIVCFGVNRAYNLDFPIQIHHYCTKTYDEYSRKKSRGDVYFVNNPHDDENFFRSDMKCTAVDYSAYKYLTKLKLALEYSAGE